MNLPWFTIGFGAVTVFACLLAVYSFWIRRKLPRYKTLERRLIGESESSLPRKLKIEYEKRSIKQLTVSYFVIWNRGLETIERQDNTHSSPLCIVLDSDDEILEANIVRKTRTVNEFEAVLVEPRKVELRFEFIDRQDGATVQIYHTSDTDQVKISGAIKGAKKGVKNLGSVPPVRPAQKKRFLLASSLLGAVGVSVFVSLLYLEGLESDLSHLVGAMASSGLLAFVVAYPQLRYIFPSELYPEDV